MTEDRPADTEVEINLSEIEFDDHGRIVITSELLATSIRDAQQARSTERMGTAKWKINFTCPSVNNTCS